MKKELFALLLLSWLLSSCSSHYVARAPMVSSPGMSMTESDKYVVKAVSTGNAEPKQLVTQAEDKLHANSQDRFVTYQVELEMLAHQPDSFISELFAITNTYGGYFLESGPSWAVVRVKSAHLRESLDHMGLLGKVKYEEIHGEDVTDLYLDLGIRLENARKARKRYLELLSQVKNIQEGLMLERELERLNREIDLLAGRVQQIENKITYATINVYYRERAKPGLLSYVGIGMYKATKWLFVRKI